jgi:hypothetical protein
MNNQRYANNFLIGSFVTYLHEFPLQKLEFGLVGPPHPVLPDRELENHHDAPEQWIRLR